MAKSTVADLFEDIAPYSHAVLAYVDRDGYPVNVAAEFTPRPERGTIELTPPSMPSPPIEGSEVNVTFSHIRPYPGVGYDQRRYVSVWGPLARANGKLEVKPERSHGWDENRMSFFELCERSVPSAHEYMRKLSSEQGHEVKAQMSLGWLIFMATRLPFLTATIVPILLGALIAGADGYSDWWLFALCLGGGSAIHLGLNIANDVSDATSGADDANVNPTMFSGGSRMIQYGLVSVEAMRIAAIACYAVGMGIGLYLVFTRGVELLWIGVIGVFLSIFYTAPPFRLVHRGLGEAAVAIGFGPIMLLGTYFVIAQRITFEALYASLPVGILIMLVLYVNQIPDRPADEKVGKRTVVVRFSKKAIVRGYAFFVALAYVLIVVGAVTGIMPVWTLIAVPTAYLGLKVYRALDSNYDSPYELMAGMGQNIMLHLFCGLALCAGYLIEIIVS
jgi:1,4-dihydroxy-2-naphthoate octaprenyltransferase